eukprot:scaffold92173_cov48-Attheya_sp.AAC.2
MIDDQRIIRKTKMMLHFLVALALLSIEANGFSWGSKCGYVRSSQSAAHYPSLTDRKCEIKLCSLNHKNTALSQGLRAGGETNDAKAIVKKNKLVHWYTSYTKLVDEKPLGTQSITVGLVSALGDILSQYIEANVAGVVFSFNWLRFNSFLVSGTLFVGPYLHYWYGVLWKVGRWGQEKYMLSKRYQTMIQVVLDQTIGVAIFFPAYFFLYEFTEALLSLRGKSWANHKICISPIDSIKII